MANKLTPPPPTGNGLLDRWLALLWRLLTAPGQILWEQVSKAGSNLTDLATRNHADLQNINTASYTHLTATNHTDLTDGGLTDLHRHTSDDVELERIGASTYSHVQHLQNLFHSAGYVSGGAVTDNGNGTVAIAAGTGAIRTSDSEVSTVKFFDFAAVASQAMTNSALNWVYIDYNAGSPVVTASTTEPPNHHVYVKLATVYRDSNELHINQTVRFNVGDHAANMVQVQQETMGYAHVSGAAISETGTRNLAVTAGAFWYGLNRFTTAALNTAVSGDFSTYYRNGSGGFTHVTAQTQVNNTQYDDGTGTLASLSANRYTNRWVYLATDSDVHVIYGQSQAVALADIQEEQPPSSLPAEIQNDSFLIGRIIVRQSTATFIQVDSAFAVSFSTSGVSNHNDLSGLQGGTTGEYYHLTSAQLTDLTDGGVTTLHSHSGSGGIGANLIINPFEVNQRALTSVGDDAYCLDRWYVLTESGNVTVAQITDPETGAPWAIRLTQPDVSSKRFGLAQIIESKDIRHLRSAAVNLSMRVKPSFAGNVRYAILEHTGTADSVTSDVVSNWASTTYTPSNFFIAGVNVIKTGTIAPGAATYGDLSDTGTFGASMNNAIVFVWTESAQAQNSTLELNRPKLEAGSAKTDFVWRPNESVLCNRYFEVVDFGITAPTTGLAGAGVFLWQPYTSPKRVAPSVNILTVGYANGSGLTIDNISAKLMRIWFTQTAAGGAQASGSLSTNSEL